MRQDTNYEIGKNLDIAMTILAMTSRLRPGYVVRESKKKEKTISQAEPNSLSRFSTQTDQSTALSVDKNSLCQENDCIL